MKLTGHPYITTKDILPSYSVMLLMILAFFAPDVQASSPADPLLFDNLKTTPQQQRVDIAMESYKAHCRKTDSTSAMACLDQLSALARNLHDKQLECSIYEMRADYFSVNRGFNPLSSAYYQKAIDFAGDNNLTIETGIYQHKKGMYYYQYKHNVFACQCFLQAQDIFKKAGFSNVPQISIYLAQLAGFYYDLGDYENARLYLMEALKYPMPFVRNKISMINTLGLICRSNKQFTKALHYFDTAHRLSVKNNDSAWIAITNGNTGSVFFEQREFSKSLPYITTDYTESLKYGQTKNAAIALLRLVMISMESNDLKNAAKQLDDAEHLIGSAATDVLNLWIEFYNLKGQLYERTGQLAEAISYRKKFELAKDSLAIRNNVTAVERVKLRWETVNHLQQLGKLENASRIATFKKNAIIAVLFLLIIITGLIYNQQILKAKKDRELLISEKRLVDEELKNASSRLLIYTENIKRKNELIENFKKEIEHLQDKFVNKADAEHLEDMMQAHIMTDENWDEFKNLFMKVHTGFFFSLKKNFPNLSGTDTRILSLMKLQLSNREMANMLGVTVDGIKKAKQRVKKKMELPAETDIEQTIAKL